MTKIHIKEQIMRDSADLSDSVGDLRDSLHTLEAFTYAAHHALEIYDEDMESRLAAGRLHTYVDSAYEYAQQVCAKADKVCTRAEGLSFLASRALNISELEQFLASARRWGSEYASKHEGEPLEKEAVSQMYELCPELKERVGEIVLLFERTWWYIALLSAFFGRAEQGMATGQGGEEDGDDAATAQKGEVGEDD